jgi:hypothetical protein
MNNMFSRQLALSICSLLICSWALAQATARQGEPPTGQPGAIERFHSPMILDLPFHAADRSTWGAGFVRGNDGVARFICDNVFFRDFAVSVERKRGEKLRITYHLVLTNEPGVDKLASVRIDLMGGEELIYPTAIPQIEVEEGKSSIRDTSITIDEKSLTAAPSPHLKITLSVKIDD